MFDFDVFQEAVISAYRVKQEEGILPSELERPAPAKLRDFCLSLLVMGLSREDIQVFTEFFTPRNQQADLETCIRRVDLNRLEPLRNFMIGDTLNPREIIVKLLAVLIDFQPRPYENWRASRNTSELKGDDKKNGGTQNTGTNDHSEGENTTTGGGEPIIDPSTPSRPRGYQLTFYIIVAITVCVGSFLLMDKYRKQCMYWEGDRYVAVRCQDKIPGVDIIALDHHILKNFKKIMRPDTLTAEHAKKVWYSKINNTVEFFTSPGFHPVHHDKALKAATTHIIETHAQEKSDAMQR